MPGSIQAACRDCADSGPGGPADYRHTVFDSPCPSWQGQGRPEVFVNTATLGLYLHAVDLTLGVEGAFALERSYNLGDSSTGPFGTGWTFNLGETVTADSDGKTWTWRHGTGRLDRFAPGLDASRFFALTSAAETLALAADGTFRLTSPHATPVRSFRADGRLSSIDVDGARRVTLVYDSAGRLTTARSLGRTLTFSYDGDHIASVGDSAGRTVAYSYTEQGQLAAQTNADGSTVAYQYDDSGRLAGIAVGGGALSITYAGDAEYPAVAALALPDGATRQYSVMQNPRQIAVTGGAGDTTLYGSSAIGLTESVTDAAGNRTSYIYDADGRRIRTVNANGETARFDYDTSSNLTAVTDAGGNKWSASYNYFGGVVHLADPNGKAWDFGYDSAGKLTSATDPLGAVVSATRDSGGRITAITDAAGNGNAFQYDADGLPAQWTDALGSTRTYGYDGAARVSGLGTPAGSVIAAEYDARNRLGAVSSGDTRVALVPAVVRDALDRVVESTDSFGNPLSYAWDANGRLAQITLPSGSIQYQYDHAGRLSKVADWAGNFASYRYDAAGSVVSVTVSGGPVVARQYDPAGKLRALVSTGSDGGVVAGYRYTRDGAGNPTILNALEPSAGWLPVAGGQMSYDGGNRIVARDDGSKFTYDLSGNLTAIEGPRAATLAWDPFGRLVDFNAGTGTAYRYDATGLRTERNAGGTVRRYVYDLSSPSPRLLVETDGDNAPVAYYVHGLSLLWKIDAASAVAYFYHFDGDGNVVAVSTTASGVVNRYRYDALGRLVSSTEGVDNAFRARGEAGWVDDGNGLLYGGGGYWFPDFRLTLGGSVGVDPPHPALAPKLAGAGACFRESVATCSLGAGRRER